MKFPQLFCFTDGRKVVDCHGSGSPMYLAPETIFEKPVGFAVDMWACGVILYLLLVSHAFSCPFNSHNTLGSLCTDALSLKKKKVGERDSLSPIYSEGRGASVHRLFVEYQRFFLACNEECRVADTSSAEDTSGGHFLRLDRNRKPRIKSLWHPGYSQK